MRSYINVSLAAFLALFFSGCVGTLNYATVISSADTPHNGHGYLFGRFTEVGGGAYMNIGLKVARVSSGTRTEQHVIPFLSPHDVNAVSVMPGQYIVSGMVFTRKGKDGDNYVEHEFDLEKAKLISFQVEASKLYYLGDFVGEVLSIPQRGFIQQKWRLKKVSYNPKQTTQEFFDRFPAFRGVDVKY